MYNSSDCSTMIRKTNIWSIYDLLLQKLTFSSCSILSIPCHILWSRTLQKIFPSTGSRLMPVLFPHMVRLPFLVSFTMTPLFSCIWYFLLISHFVKEAFKSSYPCCWVCLQHAGGELVFSWHPVSLGLSDSLFYLLLCDESPLHFNLESHIFITSSGSGLFRVSLKCSAHLLRFAICYQHFPILIFHNCSLVGEASCEGLGYIVRCSGVTSVCCWLCLCGYTICVRSHPSSCFFSWQYSGLCFPT